MGESKNTLNTTPKRMGRLDKTIVFNVLIIVKTLVCDFFVTLGQEVERSIFLEGVFGLTQIFHTPFDS